MSRPIKSIKQGGGTADFTGKIKPSEFSSETNSNNLWVGNLAADVSESDLKNLFEKHGAVDSITCYPSRSYAFMYLKRAEDAKRAKEALQGVPLLGSPLKIEFAKPAKPCKSLWVSGISSSISKEDLEQEFSKFGKIEDFKFLQEKNTVYIDYVRLEDAIKALKTMNGKKKGGTPIRVDYLRSHSRRDLGPEVRESREGQPFRTMGPLDAPWLAQDPVRTHIDPLSYGSRRPQHIVPSEGQRRDGEQPSNVLLISYPPAVHIDEQMLHNAMILFGEIEKIRSFPSRHHSFVEFRSVEEAQRAKEGLQGKLFNDPRISIMFANTPNNDFTGFIHGVKGPRPGALFNELPFQAAQLDVFGQPVVPNSFHGRVTPRAVGGSDIPMRPFAPLGSFEPLLPGAEFGASDSNPINPLGGLNWRSSPTHVKISSPLGGINPPIKPGPGTWDVFDASQIQREPKRLRTDGTMPFKEMKDRVLGTDHTFRDAPQVKGVSPLHTRFTTGSVDKEQHNVDYMWRGIIAKGGSPVCRARCVPIGDWIGYEIPEIVNCSARTGLDMLAKHYSDAVGFDIIFFLPDSEEDFASYTEFLRYLGDRNRAGVAKFDDGTTLFLVPPSEFLTKVLNVSGPERLYGVVLKFPQHAPESTYVGPSISQPQYTDKLQLPSQNEFHGLVHQEERVLQNNYSGVPHEYPKSLPDLRVPPISNPQPVHLAPPDASTSTPLAGLNLTPELIATLASLAKANSNSQQQPGNSVAGPLMTSAAPDPRQHQGWEYEHETSNLAGHQLQQVGTTFHSHMQIQPQHQTYPSNAVNDSHFPFTGRSHIHDPTLSVPQHETMPAMGNPSFQNPPQGGHFAVPLQANQLYRPDLPQDTHLVSGFEQKADTPSVYQPGPNPITSLSQVYGTNAYQPQNMVPAAGVENPNLQLPEQMQQLPSALYGASQQTLEFDADKNERYQSTLQFAANLLLQIHQKQPGTQAGATDGNQ